MKKIQTILVPIVALMVITSCQKMERPALGTYPKDAGTPGGPLKFYVAFDGTTGDASRNGVDSMRANFPSDNPFTITDGISGKAAKGDGTKFIKYSGANDFPAKASSFSISFWEKRNGIPNGNASFVFTIPSANKQWGDYGFSMFLLFDWGSWTPATSATVKFYMVDDNCKCDTWLTWEGADRVPNLQDNNWHHMVFVYDAATSKLTLYVDGVANGHVNQWGNHGPLKIDASMVQGFDLGGNENTGKMGWGIGWDGGIDQFRMYTSALTAAQVQELFTKKM